MSKCIRCKKEQTGTAYCHECYQKLGGDKQQARRDFIDKAAIELMAALILMPSECRINGKIVEDKKEFARYAYACALALYEEKERSNP